MDQKLQGWIGSLKNSYINAESDVLLLYFFGLLVLKCVLVFHKVVFGRLIFHHVHWFCHVSRPTPPVKIVLSVCCFTHMLPAKFHK